MLVIICVLRRVKNTTFVINIIFHTEKVSSKILFQHVRFSFKHLFSYIGFLRNSAKILVTYIYYNMSRRSSFFLCDRNLGKRNLCIIEAGHLIKRLAEDRYGDTHIRSAVSVFASICTHVLSISRRGPLPLKHRPLLETGTTRKRRETREKQEEEKALPACWFVASRISGVLECLRKASRGRIIRVVRDRADFLRIFSRINEDLTPETP